MLQLRGMSVLSPRTDTSARLVASADCQQATPAASFDQLVCASEQRWWNDQSQRFGRLEVNGQLVLRRSLHWQIGRLLALEDSMDVTRGAYVRLDRIGPVRDQAAIANEVAIRVDGW